MGILPTGYKMQEKKKKTNLRLIQAEDVVKAKL